MRFLHSRAVTQRAKQEVRLDLCVFPLQSETWGEADYKVAMYMRRARPQTKTR